MWNEIKRSIHGGGGCQEIASAPLVEIDEKLLLVFDPDELLPYLFFIFSHEGAVERTEHTVYWKITIRWSEWRV